MSQDREPRTRDQRSDAKLLFSALLGGASLAVAAGSLVLAVATIQAGLADKTPISYGHMKADFAGIVFGSCFAMVGGLIGLVIGLVGVFVARGTTRSVLAIAGVAVNALLLASPLALWVYR